jgi:hypothetical protein
MFNRISNRTAGAIVLGAVVVIVVIVLLVFMGGSSPTGSPGTSTGSTSMVTASACTGSQVSASLDGAREVHGGVTSQQVLFSNITSAACSLPVQPYARGYDSKTGQPFGLYASDSGAGAKLTLAGGSAAVATLSLNPTTGLAGCQVTTIAGVSFSVDAKTWTALPIAGKICANKISMSVTNYTLSN